MTLAVAPTTSTTDFTVWSPTYNHGRDTDVNPLHIREDELRTVLSARSDFRSEPSTSALSTVSNDEFTLLEALFDFVDGLAVREFIGAHAWVSALLVESLPFISLFFGDAVRAALEVVVDPESARDQELFAVIPWSGDAAEGRARLRDFDSRWWLIASLRSANALNFTLRYA